MLALEAEAASESEEDELLEDVEAGSAGADSDARKIGAFRVGARGCDSTVWDCWACMRVAVPATRKPGGVPLPGTDDPRLAEAMPSCGERL